MSTNEGYRCYRCGNHYYDRNFHPACSEKHLKELRSKCASPNQHTLKLWAKFINHQYAAWSTLFELVTGDKSPKLKDIMLTKVDK